MEEDFSTFWTADGNCGISYNETQGAMLITVGNHATFCELLRKLICSPSTLQYYKPRLHAIRIISSCYLFDDRLFRDFLEAVFSAGKCMRTTSLIRFRNQTYIYDIHIIRWKRNFCSGFFISFGIDKSRRKRIRPAK